MIDEYILPTTMVKTKVAGIVAMIVEIKIDLSNVPQYGLSYFAGGVQQFIYMYEQEFEVIDKNS